MHAWSLSGGFLLLRAHEQDRFPYPGYIPVKWDLWQVDLPKIRGWRKDDYELNVDMDISPSHLTWVAHRWIVDNGVF
jgi:hypothetical protein